VTYRSVTDPAELFQTEEELRADREQAWAAQAPADDRAHALRQLDIIAARLGDAPELADLPIIEPDHHCAVDTRLAYGLCDDCAGQLHQRRARRVYQLGRVRVCRRHALQRVQAGHRLHHMQMPEPLTPPDDLYGWLRTALRAGVTERTLALLCTDWHIDDDTRIGLQERYSDLLAAQALAAADNDPHDDQEAA
jgi:hypothetical protein